MYVESIMLVKFKKNWSVLRSLNLRRTSPLLFNVSTSKVFCCNNWVLHDLATTGVFTVRLQSGFPNMSSRKFRYIENFLKCKRNQDGRSRCDFTSQWSRLLLLDAIQLTLGEIEQPAKYHTVISFVGELLEVQTFHLPDLSTPVATKVGSHRYSIGSYQLTSACGLQRKLHSLVNYSVYSGRFVIVNDSEFTQYHF